MSEAPCVASKQQNMLSFDDDGFNVSECGPQHSTQNKNQRPQSSTHGNVSSYSPHKPNPKASQKRCVSRQQQSGSNCQGQDFQGDGGLGRGEHSSDSDTSLQSNNGLVNTRPSAAEENMLNPNWHRIPESILGEFESFGIPQHPSVNTCNNSSDKNQSMNDKKIPTSQGLTWYITQSSKIGQIGDGVTEGPPVSVHSEAVSWSPGSTAVFLEQDIISKQRHEIQILMEELGTRDQELNDLVSSHQKQVQAWELEREKYISLHSRLRNYEDELIRSDRQLKEALAEMTRVSEQRDADAMEFKRTQDEMEKLADRIKENSLYIKDMEFQNKALNSSIKDLMSTRKHLEKRELDLLKLIEEKECSLSEKRIEGSKLRDHIQFLERRCEELEEKNVNLTTESSAWKRKYCQAKDEADKLLTANGQKEDNIQKMTQQLHESLQQAIALQKALFTSCEREKCKEEVMYSLRKQHKRTMQELQNIRELYDRQNRDMTLYHLSVKEKETKEAQKKIDEDFLRMKLDEEKQSKREGECMNHVDNKFKRDKNMSSHKDRPQLSIQESEDSTCYQVKVKKECQIPSCQDRGDDTEVIESPTYTSHEKNIHTIRCRNVATITSSTTQLSDDRETSSCRSRSRALTRSGMKKQPSLSESSCTQNISKNADNRSVRSCSDSRSSDAQARLPKKATRSRTTSPILTCYPSPQKGKQVMKNTFKRDESSSDASHLVSPSKFEDELTPADSDGMCHELKRDISRIGAEKFDVSPMLESKQLPQETKVPSKGSPKSSILNPRRSSFLRKDRIEKRISFSADDEGTPTPRECQKKKSVEFCTKSDHSGAACVTDDSPDTVALSPCAFKNECSHNSPVCLKPCRDSYGPARDPPALSKEPCVVVREPPSLSRVSCARPTPCRDPPAQAKDPCDAGKESQCPGRKFMCLVKAPCLNTEGHPAAAAPPAAVKPSPSIESTPAEKKAFLDTFKPSFHEKQFTFLEPKYPFSDQKTSEHESSSVDHVAVGGEKKSPSQSSIPSSRRKSSQQDFQPEERSFSRDRLPSSEKRHSSTEPIYRSERRSSSRRKTVSENKLTSGRVSPDEARSSLDPSKTSVSDPMHVSDEERNSEVEVIFQDLSSGDHETALDTKSSSFEHIPSAHDRKSSLHDRKSSLHDRKSSLHDRKSSLHDRKSSSHDRKSSSHDRKSSSYDRKPSLRERKLSSYERRLSSIHERKSSSLDTKPSSHERMPSFHDRQSSFHDHQSSVHDRPSSAHDHQSSLVDPQSSYDDNPVSIHDRQSSIHDRQSPVHDHQSSLVDPQSSYDDNPVSIHDRHSSIHDRQSSVHDPQLSLHDRQSSIQDHQSSHDHQSSFLDPQSSIFDHQSSIHDPQTSIHDRQSTIQDRQSSFQDRQSSRKPSSHERRSSARKSSSYERKPSSHERKPSAHDRKQSSHGRKSRENVHNPRQSSVSSTEITSSERKPSSEKRLSRHSHKAGIRKQSPVSRKSSLKKVSMVDLVDTPEDSRSSSSEDKPSVVERKPSVKEKHSVHERVPTSIIRNKSPSPEQRRPSRDSKTSPLVMVSPSVRRKHSSHAKRSSSKHCHSGRCTPEQNPPSRKASSDQVKCEGCCVGRKCCDKKCCVEKKCCSQHQNCKTMMWCTEIPQCPSKTCCHKHSPRRVTSNSNSGVIPRSVDKKVSYLDSSVSPQKPGSERFTEKSSHSAMQELQVSPVVVMNYPASKEAGEPQNKISLKSISPRPGVPQRKGKMKITVEYSDEEANQKADSIGNSSIGTQQGDITNITSLCKPKTQTFSECLKKCRSNFLKNESDLAEHHGIYSCKDSDILKHIETIQSAGKRFTPNTRRITHSIINDKYRYGRPSHRSFREDSLTSQNSIFDTVLDGRPHKYKTPRVDPFLGQQSYSKVCSTILPTDVGLYLSQQRGLYCNNNKSLDSQSDAENFSSNNKVKVEHLLEGQKKTGDTITVENQQEKLDGKIAPSNFSNNPSDHQKNKMEDVHSEDADDDSVNCSHNVERMSETSSQSSPTENGHRERNYFYSEATSTEEYSSSAEAKTSGSGIIGPVTVPISKPFTSTKGPSLYKQLSQIHYSEQTRRYEWVEPTGDRAEFYTDKTVNVVLKSEDRTSPGSHTNYDNNTGPKLQPNVVDETKSNSSSESLLMRKSSDSGLYSLDKQSFDRCHSNKTNNCNPLKDVLPLSHFARVYNQNNNSFCCEPACVARDHQCRAGDAQCPARDLTMTCHHQSTEDATQYSDGGPLCVPSDHSWQDSSLSEPGVECGEHLMPSHVPDPIVRRLNFDDMSLNDSIMPNPKVMTLTYDPYCDPCRDKPLYKGSKLGNGQSKEIQGLGEDMKNPCCKHDHDELCGPEQIHFFLNDRKSNIQGFLDDDDDVMVEDPGGHLNSSAIGSESESANNPPTSLPEYFKDISTLLADPNDDRSVADEDELCQDGDDCDDSSLVKHLKPNVNLVTTEYQTVEKDECWYLKDPPEKPISQADTQTHADYGEKADASVNPHKSITVMNQVSLGMVRDTHVPREIPRHNLISSTVKHYNIMNPEWPDSQLEDTRDSNSSTLPYQSNPRVPHWVYEESEDAAANHFDEKLSSFLEDPSHDFGRNEVLWNASLHHLPPTSPSTKLYKLLLQSQELLHSLEQSSAIPEALRIKVAVSSNRCL
ncbi:unnamed protein product [Lymnaea stagnalis]|uniref:Uncharacterized protein n=1 Tax=Lymnaea stagnalis TaxID=6523 RepID=A0AAV2IFA8_LYMST